MKTAVYYVKETPFAFATLLDLGPGKGLLQIHSDWGTYSHLWSSMGEQDLREFLLSADSSYIEGKMMQNMHFMGCKKEAFQRLTKFMAHCWPRLREAFKGDPL